MHESEVVSGRLVETRRDAAVVFDSVHEALDEVSSFVFLLVPVAFRRSVAARRDDRFGAAFSDDHHQFVRVVSLVTDYTSWFIFAQQFGGARHIMFLARTETEFHSLALGIYGNVQFATETAARPSERFVDRFVFLGAPPAC